MFKKRNLIFISLLVLGVFLISGCWLISTPTYTVTYDGNGYTGGSVPTDSTVYEENDTVTVLDKGALLKTGYTFAGWNTAAEGSGTDHAVGSTFTMGVADVTLYAKWATNTYTVTFNSQGGSTVSSQTVEHGGKITKPTNPTRTGYTFAGWYRESGCTTPWNFATDTVTSNVTLYAKWATNTYTVTFDKNGGDTEADPKTKAATHGGTVGTLPTEPTRTDYTFASWNTEAGGGGTEFTAVTAVTADITVYAQWTIVVGASYGGGIVAYILQSEDPGYDANVQHGLIAATADQNGGAAIAWSNIENTLVGTTGTAIGIGQANTTAIVGQDGCTSGAAWLCNYLTEGGYTDWFLPSMDELNKLYLNKVTIGGFAEDEWWEGGYWSSSEATADLARAQGFYDGTQFTGSKGGIRHIRAVRAF